MTKLQRFIPQTPDPYLRQSDQLGSVKFGHLNALVDAINSTVYGDYLQLAGDGPMSTTLRALEDPEGNIANLYLATDKTAISGSLKIGDATSNVPSAILQIDSTTQGVLFPRMSLLERDAIASPEISLIIFNTDDNELQLWDGIEWTSVGGGLEFIQELYSDTTQATSAITPLTDAVDANIAIIPKGTGAITADIPDGTVAGGNSRGTNAVDLQSLRTANTQVASGPNSIAIGVSNTSSGTSSVVLGNSNSASGAFSTIGGGTGNSVNKQWDVISGGRDNLVNTSNGYGYIGGGTLNLVTSLYGVVSGGSGNTASTGTHATVVGGQSNVSSGQYSISGGYSNVASGSLGSIALGYDNNAVDGTAIGKGNNASFYNSTAIGMNNTATGSNSTAFGASNSATGGSSIVIGGYANSATNNYSISGGQSNTSSGTNSLALGRQNQATNNSSIAIGYLTVSSGQRAIAIGAVNEAAQASSMALGFYSKSYLWGQISFGSESIVDNSKGYLQNSILNASKFDDLTTGGTTVLSLDGTGTTNLIIPEGQNRAWNVKVETIAVVIGTSGTVDGVSVGDSLMQDDTILFTKVGGTSSVVGVNNTNLIASTSMGTAGMSFAAGASQELAITFTAPTFTGGGSVTCRVVSKVSLVEVAW